LTSILSLGVTTFVCLQQECVRVRRAEAAAFTRARPPSTQLPPPPPPARPRRRYQHEGVRESEWRFGHKLRPYIFDAIQLVDALPRACRGGGRGG
jgi:hypothetical protein